MYTVAYIFKFKQIIVYVEVLRENLLGPEIIARNCNVYPVK